MARWAYFKAHWPNFELEGLYYISPTFWQMATSTNLLGTKTHKVQENLGGRKDLWAANQAAKSSSNDIHFFIVVAPTELLKIMGFKGIHSPKALWWQSGLTFCPWCRKEGQNEGTVVNHLQTTHYHLGLICACCLDYFTTSADTMHQHAQLCKSMAASDDDDDREESPTYYKEDDNSDEDFEVHVWRGLACPSTPCPMQQFEL